MAFAQHRGAGGLHGDHLDVGVLRLQVLARAGKRAAGAHASDQDVHLAIGIRPDLGAGGALMDGGVRRVGELAGDERVRNLLGQLGRASDGALHALAAVGEHQLSAVGLHKVATLDRHGFRHGDDDAVAAGGGQRAQADAGVAGGRLDDDGVGIQLALGLGLVEHRLRDTVLHRTSRVEQLHLAHDGGLKVVVLLVIGQLHQRSAADQLGHALVDGHDVPLSLVRR